MRDHAVAEIPDNRLLNLFLLWLRQGVPFAVSRWRSTRGFDEKVCASVRDPR
jgi:hypothetical protein